MYRLNLQHPVWPLIGAGLGILNSALLVAVWVALIRRLRSAAELLGAHAHRDAERIFEQLDLLRVDAQELSATAGVGAGVGAGTHGYHVTETNAGGADYGAAARLAAKGTGIQEISERCGIVSGEARILVALQQARARSRGVA